MAVLNFTFTNMETPLEVRASVDTFIYKFLDIDIRNLKTDNLTTWIFKLFEKYNYQAFKNEECQAYTLNYDNSKRLVGRRTLWYFDFIRNIK